MPVLKKISYLCLTFALLACSMSFAPPQLPAARGYQVKAVFLFNFSQFVEWPANAFTSAQAPIVIGILGDDPFGSFLDETVSGEKVNGHPLLVQRYNNVKEIKSCHILFINLAETNMTENVLANLKGRNILTVSDAGEFLQQGGMIRFFVKSNKIQLQINLDAARAGNLVISSKLLRLAEIFVPDK